MLTITLPLPDGRMSGHAKGHWREKSKLTKNLRKLAWTEMLARVSERWPAATIHYAFYLDSARRTDEANLIHRCKAYIDGIVDAGLIADDNWNALHIGSVSVQIDRENPRVELTLERKPT